MKKLEKLYTNLTNANILISKEDLKNINNSKTLLNSRNLSSSILKPIDFSTDFEVVNSYIENNEITLLYKQWDIVILKSKEMEEQLKLILPFIKYNIIYKEPKMNNLNFYSSPNDLYTNAFYEIKEDAPDFYQYQPAPEPDYYLLLHVSFCIHKTFITDKLIVPQAKLHIIFQNPVVVNN